MRSGVLFDVDEVADLAGAIEVHADAANLLGRWADSVLGSLAAGALDS